MDHPRMRKKQTNLPKQRRRARLYPRFDPAPLPSDSAGGRNKHVSTMLLAEPLSTSSFQSTTPRGALGTTLVWTTSALTGSRVGERPIELESILESFHSVCLRLASACVSLSVLAVYCTKFSTALMKKYKAVNQASGCSEHFSMVETEAPKRAQKQSPNFPLADDGF